MSNSSKLFTRSLHLCLFLTFNHFNDNTWILRIKKVKTIKQTQQNQHLQEWLCLCMPQTGFFLLHVNRNAKTGCYCCWTVHTVTVRNAKIRSYAVCRLKMKQYAVCKGGGVFHPHDSSSRTQDGFLWILVMQSVHSNGFKNCMPF